MGHETADPALVRAHKEGLAEPDPNDLHFDMKAGPDSEWNTAVLDILLKTMKKMEKKSTLRYPHRSDAYFLDLVRDKYKRARSSWKRAQPKQTDMDIEETPAQVEDRLVTSKESQLKLARTRERRVAVSGRQLLKKNDCT